MTAALLSAGSVTGPDRTGPQVIPSPPASPQLLPKIQTAPPASYAALPTSKQNLHQNVIITSSQRRNSTPSAHRLTSGAFRNSQLPVNSLPSLLNPVPPNSWRKDERSRPVNILRGCNKGSVSPYPPPSASIFKRLTKLHVLKTYGRVDVKLHTFINSAADGRE